MESCLKSFLLLLIAGFSKQGKHILLVAFYAGLVERIYAEQIAGNCASLFEEIDQCTQGFLREIRNMEDDIRHAAVGVRQYGSLKGFSLT